METTTTNKVNTIVTTQDQRNAKKLDHCKTYDDQFIAKIIIKIYKNLGNFKRSNDLAKVKQRYDISNKRYTGNIKLLLQQTTEQKNKELKNSLNFEFWKLVEINYNEFFQTNEKFTSACIDVAKQYATHKDFIFDNYKYIDKENNLLDTVVTIYKDKDSNFYKVSKFCTLDINSLAIQQRVITILKKCFDAFTLKHKKSTLGKKDTFSNVYANNSVKAIRLINYDHKEQKFSFFKTEKSIDDLALSYDNFAKDAKELLIEALKPQPITTKKVTKKTTEKVA